MKEYVLESVMDKYNFRNNNQSSQCALNVMVKDTMVPYLETSKFLSKKQMYQPNEAIDINEDVEEVRSNEYAELVNS